MRDTIYALSSGHPPAGVAIIRISGPGVRFGLETVSGPIPEPRRVKLTDIRDASGCLLDQGLVVFFPGPHSFTGEDVAELQIHGSRASISAVLGALSGLPGFRPAEAGEFTRRAFEAGRIDLTAVEGLSDLIRAETESQRKQALGQANGGLRELYEGWATRLTYARAMIEADIDFSDEDDIPGSVADQIWPEVKHLIGEITDHLARARNGEIIRSGFRIALVGPPNVGKSSLLNCLAQRDVAIVSDVPGTTRDIIEVRLDIGGHLVVLMDTAGIRESEDQIELEGVRRSLMAADSADLVLELRNLYHPTEHPMDDSALPADRLVVWTKSDLVDSDVSNFPDGDIAVSSKTGRGVEMLIGCISNRLSNLDIGESDALPTRERHSLLLNDSIRELQIAVDQCDDPIEIRSEHLRNAAISLGEITGSVDVEQLLGVIFSEFCVGK